MTYSLAIREDKRNILQIFKSIIFPILELIYLIIGDEKIKEILILEFILSLFFNLFFNTFLYSDKIVSHKYHNNGKLDFIITLCLPLISNIIVSIICNYLNFSNKVEEGLEQLKEIK